MIAVKVSFVTVKGWSTNHGVDQLQRLVVEAHGCLLAPQACTESRPKTERADPIDLLAVADFVGVPVGERGIYTPTPPANLVLNGK